MSIIKQSIILAGSMAAVANAITEEQSERFVESLDIAEAQTLLFEQDESDEEIKSASHLMDLSISAHAHEDAWLEAEEHEWNPDYVSPQCPDLWADNEHQPDAPPRNRPNWYKSCDFTYSHHMPWNVMTCQNGEQPNIALNIKEDGSGTEPATLEAGGNSTNMINWDWAACAEEDSERAACPSIMPYMCKNPRGCANGKEHCCVLDEDDCIFGYDRSSVELDDPQEAIDEVNHQLDILAESPESDADSAELLDLELRQEGANLALHNMETSHHGKHHGWILVMDDRTGDFLVVLLEPTGSPENGLRVCEEAVCKARECDEDEISVKTAHGHHIHFERDCECMSEDWDYGYLTCNNGESIRISCDGEGDNCTTFINPDCHEDHEDCVFFEPNDIPSHQGVSMIWSFCNYRGGRANCPYSHKEMCAQPKTASPNWFYEWRSGEGIFEGYWGWEPFRNAKGEVVYNDHSCQWNCSQFLGGKKECPTYRVPHSNTHHTQVDCITRPGGTVSFNPYNNACVWGFDWTLSHVADVDSVDPAVYDVLGDASPYAGA